MNAPRKALTGQVHLEKMRGDGVVPSDRRESLAKSDEIARQKLLAAKLLKRDEAIFVALGKR